MDGQRKARPRSAARTTYLHKREGTTHPSADAEGTRRVREQVRPMLGKEQPVFGGRKPRPIARANVEGATYVWKKEGAILCLARTEGVIHYDVPRKARPTNSGRHDPSFGLLDGRHNPCSMAGTTHVEEGTIRLRRMEGATLFLKEEGERRDPVLA